MKRLSLFFAILASCFTMQAAVINCQPAGDLSWYYGQAQPGDTLLMADGIYDEAYTMTFDKEGVVLKAAEGAKPVIALTGEWTTIGLYASTTFDGIGFDGTNKCYYPISSYGSDAGTYTFKNCEFTGWMYWAISNHYEANTHVDNVLIENCLFHDAAGSAIYFNDDAPTGEHACANFEMKNSTLYNLVEDEYVGVIHVSSRSEATGAQNKVVIDHITMYDCTTPSLGGITIRKSSDLSITNSIIAYSTNTDQYAFYIYGGKVENTIYYNGLLYIA